MKKHEGSMAINKLKVPTIDPPLLKKNTPVWVKMDSPVNKTSS